MPFPIAETYFFNHDWKVFPFQKECWEHIAQGKSGLLNAPTGSGKTFAIWFGILEKLANEKKLGKRKKRIKCL